MYGYHFFGRRTLLFFIHVFLFLEELIISYSLVHSLSTIDKREWISIHRKRTKLLVRNYRKHGEREFSFFSNIFNKLIYQV